MANKLQSLTEAGIVAQNIHIEVEKLIKTGTNLLDIENLISKIILDAGMKPSFKGFHSYPSASCLSVNEVIVHGIPYNYVLEENDIISIDFGVTNNSWIVDTARTFSVGNNLINKNLINTVEEALKAAIETSLPGKKTGDIGDSISQVVKKHGFYVVRDLMGHGVGKTLQEPPQIPNFGRPSTGQIIKEGMVLAIEPIITQEKCEIRVKSDNWGIISKPTSLAAHTEDTIYISKNGPVILTRRDKPGKI